MSGIGTPYVHDPLPAVRPIDLTPERSTTPGVSSARSPGKIPGLKTAIYRSEPGTREYIFDDSGMEIPGAAAQMEDRMNFLGQHIEAIQQAGGTIQNSPQLVAMVAQHDAMQKALNDRLGSEAQVAQGEAMKETAAAKTREVSPEFLNAAAGLKLLELNPALGNEPGYQKAYNLPRVFAGSAIDKSPDLASAIKGLQAGGQSSVEMGSPEHQFLAQKFGPDLTAALSGEQPHLWGNTDPALVRGFLRRPGATAAAPPVPMPLQNNATSQEKPKGNIPATSTQNVVTPGIGKKANERYAAVYRGMK